MKDNNGDGKYTKKTYAYVAAALTVAGAVAFGASFTVLGIYAIIASLLCEISALTFVNIQKRKNDLKWLLYVKIASYAVFIIAVALLAGGVIWASQNN